MKKLLAIIFAAVLCFALGVVAFAADLPVDWANCTACSAENPHLISTTADLNKIRTHIDTVNQYGGESNCINGYFKLANDIVFSDSDYTEGGAFYNPSRDNLNFGFLPIGHTGGQQNMVGNMFVGEFDGNGKTIKNFKTWTDSDTARWFNALFARTWDAAYIHDFTMSDSYIRGSHTAAIVGQANSGTTRIENISLKNVTLENDWLSSNSNKGSGMIAGMFQGTIKNINIENCTYKNHNTSVYGGLIAGKYLGGNGVQNITIKGGHYDVDSTSGLLFGSVGGNTTISGISVSGTEVFVRDNNFRYFAYGMDSNATVSNIHIDVDIVGGNANTSTQKLTNNNMGNATGITLNVDFSGKTNGNTLEGNLNARVEKNVIYISKQTANYFKLVPATQEICVYLNGGTFDQESNFAANVPTTPVNGEKICVWCTDETLNTPLSGTPTAGTTYYAKWVDSKITYNANNGMDNETVQYANLNDALKEENTFTYTGHEFAGWCMEDGTLYTGTTVTDELKGEHTLYAVWSVEIGGVTYTVNPVAPAKTYTGKPLQPYVTVTKNSEDYRGYRLVYDADEMTNVGTKTIDVYIGEQKIGTARFTIEPAKLTANYVSENITIGEEPKLVITVTGFVNGENESVLTKKPSIDGTVPTEVGEHKLTLSGGEADNYEFEYVSGTLTIKEKEEETKPDPKPESKPEPCDHSFDANGKCKYCGIIVIDHTTEKSDDELNPNTGAESAIGVAAAVAALSLAGIEVSKKK